MFTIMALTLAPIYAVGSKPIIQTSQMNITETEFSEINATIGSLVQALIYETDDFDLKVTVPSYVNASTPDDKNPARLNIYLKKKEALSGLFSIDVESGIKVRLPEFALYLFVDIDLTILGRWKPDLFHPEWPIFGIHADLMSLESGDIGVYASVVPIKAAEGGLQNLTMGEWSHIGSYDLYVVEEQKFVLMSLPAENITIGNVTSLGSSVEPVLEPIHVRLTSKGFGYCDYSNDLISISLESMSEELYPNDILTLETRIEAKTNVYFSHLTLNVYGVKEVEGEFISDVIGNITVLSGIGLARGAVRAEEFELTIPEDTLPGLLYSVVSAVFAEGEELDGWVVIKTPETCLYDDFTLVYVKNKPFENLQEDYNELLNKFNNLNSTYDQLQLNYNSLESDHASLQSGYHNTRNLVYIFMATTIILIAITVYFAKRKPKL